MCMSYTFDVDLKFFILFFLIIIIIIVIIIISFDKSQRPPWNVDWNRAFDVSFKKKHHRFTFNSLYDFGWLKSRYTDWFRYM